MSIGDKMLGWFIVEENEDGEVVRKAPPPVPPAPAPRPVRTAPPVALAAGAEDQQLLGRVLTLLASLPPEASPDMKRTVVTASLAAFGVRVDAVVSQGKAALVALETHGATARQKHEATLATATERIATLEAEITTARQLIATERTRHDDATAALETEKAKLRSALAFFQAS